MYRHSSVVVSMFIAHLSIVLGILIDVSGYTYQHLSAFLGICIDIYRETPYGNLTGNLTRNLTGTLRASLIGCLFADLAEMRQLHWTLSKFRFVGQVPKKTKYLKTLRRNLTAFLTANLTGTLRALRFARPYGDLTGAYGRKKTLAS